MQIYDMQSDSALKIIRSNLLTQEDLDYIISIHPKILQVLDEGPSTSAPTLPARFSTLSFQHYCFVAVSVIIAAVTFNVSLWISFLVPVVLPVMWLVQIKVAAEWKAKLQGDVNKLAVFLQTNEKYQTLLQKCIRFIQEMEIAAMGYTLISGKTPIRRLERSRQKVIRECMQLRYQCLKSSVDSILQYRSATLDFQNTCTSTQDANFCLSICQIPLEELGPCFVEEATYSELADATDNFCLDILRDTSQFLIQQRSEFLKLLFLNILKKSPKEKPNLPLETFETLKRLCEADSKKLGDLYELHLTAQLNANNDDSNQDSKLKKTLTPTAKSSLCVAVHSIQVHLRAALLVAIECDKHLEEFGSVDELKDGLLQQLKIHLDASIGCLAETSRCFNHDSSEAREEKSAKVTETPTKCINGTLLQVDSSLLSTQDDFTEDQIFEGTPDDTKEAGNKIDDDTEFTNNRKKRVEETEYVMKELKSVLHVKTSAQEREIRKSKLFPNYVPKVIHTDGDDDSKIDETDLSVQQIEANSEYKPSNNTLIKSGDSTQTYNAEHRLECKGELPAFTHKILTMPRRPLPPGRTKHRPLRSERRINTTGINEREEIDTISTDHGPVGLGFGFPSLLASQAVQVALDAKRRNAEMSLSGTTDPCIGLVGNETTFGESDSDS